MDGLFQEIGKALLTYGPGGLLAALAILALIFERKDRKEERKEYDAEIKQKDAEHIETLNKWRLDTSMQSEKMAAFIEKASIIIDAQSKRDR